MTNPARGQLSPEAPRDLRKEYHIAPELLNKEPEHKAQLSREELEALRKAFGIPEWDPFAREKELQHEEAMKAFRNIFRPPEEQSKPLQPLSNEKSTQYEPSPFRRPLVAMNSFKSGLIHEEKGQDKEAIADYQNALASDPRNPETNNRLGIVLTRSGHATDAIAHFKKALTLRPNDASIHRNLGLALQLADISDEAQREFAEAKRLDHH